MEKHRPALIDRSPVSAEAAEWLGRVEKISPVLREFQEEGEAQRFSPTPVFEALRELGFHRMFVSRALGGAQVSLQTGSAVLQALARVDPSVSWQMAVNSAIGRLSDYLPEATARGLFLEQDRLVVGSVNPSGVADVVDGGFVLHGTWAFASGSAHAGWLVCAARILQDGAPRLVDGRPEIRMLFVPLADVVMLDTWHSLGLRATGSRHYQVDHVFVPEDATVRQADMFLPPPDRPGRGYAISYYDFGLFGSGSTILGIASGALEAFREVALSKVPAAGSQTLAAGHVTQDQFARAEVLVRSARLLLGDAAWHAAEHGSDGGDDLSALVRVAAAATAEKACGAVDILFRLAGTTSVYTGDPLERFFRDANTAAKHITLSATNFEMVGQYLLGGELQMRR